MNIRILSVATALLIATVVLSQEDSKTEKHARRSPAPIYIEPFYDSDGLKISVGEHSKKLEEADEKTILEIASDLRKNKDTLRIEVLYGTAIRLYDLGHKDDAVYWFYMAQYRARLFQSILDKSKMGTIGSQAFELAKAHEAFQQLAGKYINGYAFGDLDKLDKTLRKVVDEGKDVPNYGELYPSVNFEAENGWAEKNKKVSDGLTKLIDYIRTNAESIKEQRKLNGIEGKY